MWLRLFCHLRSKMNLLLFPFFIYPRRCPYRTLPLGWDMMGFQPEDRNAGYMFTYCTCYYSPYHSPKALSFQDVAIGLRYIGLSARRSKCRLYVHLLHLLLFPLSFTQGVVLTGRCHWAEICWAFSPKIEIIKRAKLYLEPISSLWYNTAFPVPTILLKILFEILFWNPSRYYPNHKLILL